MARRIRGTSFVNRVLFHLSNRKGRGELTYSEGLALQLATLTVYQAFFKAATLPFQRACRQLHFEPPPQFIAPEKMLAFPAAPAEPEIFELDGRTSVQWHRSIIAYLQWRTGHAWRPARHRYHPTVGYYVDGIRLAIAAFTGQLPLPPRRMTQSTPLKRAA